MCSGFFLSFFKELNKTFISVIIKYLKIFLAGPKAKTENDCYLLSTSFFFFSNIIEFLKKDSFAGLW